MDYSGILDNLELSGNMRSLSHAVHDGKYIIDGGVRMLNLSSNDYLGLASDRALVDSFMESLHRDELLFSSTSSRLLTGNFQVSDRLEERLKGLFGSGAALTFCSGYHMNTGILPAVTDSSSLILADKLVHASIIDGIRLSPAKVIRFRHQDFDQLERLVAENAGKYTSVIIVTESIFSMDGDVTDLRRMVEIKKCRQNVMLYVDEAHAFGVRGETGLGIAQEQGCIRDIDFLCGTFGKAAASVGAYLICSEDMRRFLVNRMRTFIFTTALPPLNQLWTLNVIEHLAGLGERRTKLEENSRKVRSLLKNMGLYCPSDSHIIPFMVGGSHEAVLSAEDMRRKGFYLLPIRPPTVPEGTSRLRISMTAAIDGEETDRLLAALRHGYKSENNEA
jgi:hypothetical protein